MNLRVLRSKLLELTPHLIKERETNGVYAGLEKFRESIRTLTDLELFPELVEPINTHAVFENDHDQLSLSGAVSESLYKHSFKLLMACQGLIRAINSLYPPVEANTVFIKINNSTSFGDISKSINKLDQALNQVLNEKKIGAKIKINSVEPGSMWFEVALGISIATSALGSLFWSAAVIYKKIQEGRILAQKVDALKITNNAKEQIKEALEVEKQALINIEASNYQNEYLNPDNAEQKERIVFSIKTFAELIENGTEINPALETPENVKNLFPKKSNMLQIESRVKKLTAPPLKESS